MSILNKLTDLFSPRSTEKVDLMPDLSKKNEALYAELKRQLGSKTLYYPGSESDSPISIVRLPWYRIYRWKREPDGVEGRFLDSMMGGEDKNVSRIGLTLMTQDNLVGIKRPGSIPTKYDMYLLSHYGFWMIGIKITGIVET